MATLRDIPQLPTFGGSSDENGFDWLRNFRRFAAFRELNDGKKLQLFQYLLKSSAADWLESLPVAATDTYEHLEQAFRERYETSDIVKYRTAKDIFNRRQLPTETVDTFISDVRKLGRTIEAHSSMIKMAILNGLQPQIASHVVRQQPETIEDILAAARIAEATIPPSDNLVGHQLSDMQAEIQRLSSKLDRCTTNAVGMDQSTISRRNADARDNRRTPSPTTTHYSPGTSKRVTFARRDGSPSYGNTTPRFGRNRGYDDQRANNTYGSYGTDRRDRREEKSWQDTTRQQPSCTRCGYKHRNNYCPASDPRRLCWQCGSPGHLQSQCKSGHPRRYQQN